ncbi:hypothetical protein GCM10023094_36280 [Rhodococcus olei]|uniref:Uncharacterized protein n=1 Tax=Rhodococcus olei TaxID=2161675 RepID=A0ABP8PBD2_9NOCA
MARARRVFAANGFGAGIDGNARSDGSTTDALLPLSGTLFDEPAIGDADTRTSPTFSLDQLQDKTFRPEPVRARAASGRLRSTNPSVWRHDSTGGCAAYAAHPPVP